MKYSNTDLEIDSHGQSFEAFGSCLVKTAEIFLAIKLRYTYWKKNLEKGQKCKEITIIKAGLYGYIFSHG